jgi:hypothetical protein
LNLLCAIGLSNSRTAERFFLPTDKFIESIEPVESLEPSDRPNYRTADPASGAESRMSNTESRVMNDSQAAPSPFKLQHSEFDIMNRLVKAAGCRLPTLSPLSA